MIYASELLDSVPRSAHDRPVLAAVTEAGLRRFRRPV